MLKACCLFGVKEHMAVGCAINSSLMYRMKSSHGTILLSTVFLRLTIAYFLSDDICTLIGWLREQRRSKVPWPRNLISRSQRPSQLVFGGIFSTFVVSCVLLNFSDYSTIREQLELPRYAGTN